MAEMPNFTVMIESLTKRELFAAMAMQSLSSQNEANPVAGQELTKTPSKEYVAVALEVQRWIQENKK